MVDAVNIVGIDGDALASALRASPAWATEHTLVEIKGLLAAQGSSKGGKGGKDIVSRAQQSILDKFFNRLKKETAEAEKQAAKDKKLADERAERELLHGRGLTTMTQKMLFVSAALSQMGDAISATFKSNVDSYTALQQGGLSLTNGMEGASNGFESLQQLSALTGVRFTELSAAMLKNSIAINAFGVGKFAKTVGLAKNELTEFGFSSKESADLLGVYLESMRGYTDASNRTVEETRTGLVAFGKKINNLSMASGMARNAILSNIDAISKSTEATVLTAQVGATASEETQKFLATFKDQNVAKMMLKMMTDPIKTINSTFMSFQKIGLGNFGQKMMAFTQSIAHLKAEDKAAAMADFVRQNKSEIDRATLQANTFSQFGATAGDANNALTALAGFTQTARQFAEQKAKADKDPALQARAKFAESWERLMAQMQIAFGPPVSLLTALSKGLDYLTKSIESVTTKLGPEVTGYIGVVGVIVGSLASVVLGLKGVNAVLNLVGLTTTKMVISPFKMLGNSITTMGRWFTSLGGAGKTVIQAVSSVARGLFSLLNPFGKVVAAFTGGYIIGTILYEMISDFQWFTEMMDTIFSGLDEVLKYIPGFIGADARERIKNKEALAAQNSTTKSSANVASSKPTNIANGNVAPKSREISVPKDPAPSTIESPSAKPAKEPSKTSETAPNVSDPITSTPPGLDTNAGSNDINNLLAFQNSVLEQILLSTNNSISVNKDILKYTRANA